MTRKRKRSPGAGRPVEIGEPTVVTTFNLTEGQKEWIQRLAEERNLSSSDIMREILHNAMQKTAVGKPA